MKIYIFHHSYEPSVKFACLASSLREARLKFKDCSYFQDADWDDFIDECENSYRVETLKPEGDFIDA